MASHKAPLRNHRVLLKLLPILPSNGDPSSAAPKSRKRFFSKPVSSQRLDAEEVALDMLVVPELGKGSEGACGSMEKEHERAPKQGPTGGKSR